MSVRTISGARSSTIERHIAAQPLIMQLWEEAVHTGMPIARPLWLHHPDDQEARVQDQQWLLGPDVLVAPVVEEGATRREVHFPDGCWEHAERGDRHEGPGYDTVEAPLEVLPYYFHCGTDPFAAATASNGRADTKAGAAPNDRSLPTTGGAAGGLGALALLAVGAIRRRRRGRA